MKENSIEEALKKLSTVKKIKIYELLRTFKREGIENFVTTRKKYIDVILSDYKRVLKENEELLEVKVSASANNRILELEKENKELKEELETEQNERLLCHIREKQMIPVQKVKDNIEKLKAQYKTALEKNSTEAFILKCQITILQELIKESEE